MALNPYKWINTAVRRAAAFAGVLNLSGGILKWGPDKLTSGPYISHLVYLSSLDLQHVRAINLSGAGVGHVDIVALADLMSRHPHVEALDLSHNSIDSAGAKVLAARLHEWEGISRLDLTGNPICDVGANAISVAIARGSGVTSLILSSCNLGCDGIDALSANTGGLVTLDVTRNNIDKASLIPLLMAAYESSHMEELFCTEPDVNWADPYVLFK